MILLPASAFAEEAREYQFSEDWFSGNISNWERILGPYQGKPDLHYLEVGVFEGRATVWIAENILTHPSSQITGLDVFPGGLKERYLSNLAASGFTGKSKTLVGFSQKTLRDLPAECCDIIYIDGSHHAADVLTDTVLAWRLLKPGGLLIFDDYQWQRDRPAELRPRTAIDAFITANRGEIEVVLRDYQLVIRKRPNPCGAFRSDCTRFGHYIYFWTDRVLRDQRKWSEGVDLEESDRLLIEAIARSERPGEVGHFVQARTLRSPGFNQLREKLNLKLKDQIILPYIPADQSSLTGSSEGQLNIP